MAEVVEMLVELARRGTRVPAETELDRFTRFVEAGAVITQAHAFGIYAELGERERTYKPDGGLTEVVYRLGEDDHERAILTRGILEGELVRRGHKYLAVRDTLDRYERHDLRDLAEAYTFNAVADILEGSVVKVRARGSRSRRADSHRGSEPRPFRGSEEATGTALRSHPPTPTEMSLERRLRELEDRLIAVHDRWGDGAGRGRESHGPSPYLDAEQAAAYLGVTIKSLYGLKERGRLKSLPGSRRLRFTIEMLDRFMKGEAR